MIMVKKIALLLCVFGLLAVQPLCAQNPHSELNNEIGVDAGPVSVAGGFVFGSIGFWSSLGASLNHKAVDTRLYGCYGIHYYYQVKHWCAVGVKTVVEGSRTTFYTDSTRTAIEKINDDVFFSIMPSVRFTYLNRPWVRLYSTVDVGLNLFFSSSTASDAEKKCQPYFAWNITPIGVCVGKKFYGLFEVNIGYDALAKVGIGARF
jgi:hypothetical protein